MKISFLNFAFLGTLMPSLILSCKTPEELDNCAYEMSLLGNSDLQIPSNDAQVVEMCSKVKTGIKCLKDDAHACMKGPLKSIIIKSFNDWEKHFNIRCDTGPHRADFLKHVNCFSDSAKADALRLCADKHMVMMEKVSKLPRELSLGGSCCTSIGMRECVLGAIQTHCSGESGDYFSDMIQEMTGENHQMMCNQYSSLDQCNAKYDPTAWKDLKAILDSSDVTELKKSHQYKTVIPILIKMMNASNGRKQTL